MPYLYLGIVHFDLGDLEEAQGCVEQALRLSQKNNEKHWEGCSRIWLGRILGKTERAPDGSEDEYIFQGMKILDELRIKPLSTQGHLFLGEQYADRGHQEKALGR
jgi:tetratricopeptide (TPR) repeat protein